jgi:hypothetical protein
MSDEDGNDRSFDPKRRNVLLIPRLDERDPVQRTPFTVMAGLVPAIHAVQLQQWDSFARLLPQNPARSLSTVCPDARRGWPGQARP